MVKLGPALGALLLLFVLALVVGTGACSSSSGSGSGTGIGADGGKVVEPPCKQNSDCPSHICASSGTCAVPSCTDGAKNGSETDIDCGGSCPACDTLKSCAVAADCQSGVCSAAAGGGALQCQAPTSTDGVKNGNETGIDCGGMGNPTCAAGQGCAARSDCTSDVCLPADGGTGMVCTTPVCNDNEQDGMETDVDCGGPACPGCADGKACAVGSDCKDEVCAASTAGAPLTCQAASYTDGVKNGTETDVDCGGSGDPTKNACAATKSCLAATDCQSDGCDYTKHCAIRRSCVGTSTSGGHYGADTCGRGGAGSTGTQAWESCCTTVDVKVTEGMPAKATTVKLDKYKVTAGRMRAFLEAVNYDVKDFIAGARAAGQVPVLPTFSSSNVTGQTVLDPTWDMYLPTSLAGDMAETPDCDLGNWDATTDTCTAVHAPVYSSVQNQLGSTIFKANSQPLLQGCSYDSPGTHTFYLGATDDKGKTAEYAQSDYDQKPIQCVDYLMAQAFCIWDGGRLETLDEWAAAWGPAAMPWSGDTTDKESRGIAYSGLLPLAGTTNTYTACRFPQANDSTIGGAGLGCPKAMIPTSTQTLELADYKYSYEYPALLNAANDYAPFIAAPGRMLGRGPTVAGVEGAADIVGDLLEMTSDITGTGREVSPFPTPSVKPPTVIWAANGSWEVHAYNARASYGAYSLLDKYGKQGVRCVHPE